MMRQPDEPSKPDCLMVRDGKLYRYDDLTAIWVETERKPFWRFFWDGVKADWEINRYSVLTAICVCLAPALFLLALALLP